MRKPLFQSSSRHDKRKISKNEKKNLLKYQNSLNEDLQNVVCNEKVNLSQEDREVREKAKMLKKDAGHGLDTIQGAHDALGKDSL